MLQFKYVNCSDSFPYAGKGRQEEGSVELADPLDNIKTTGNLLTWFITACTHFENRLNHT